MPAEVTLESDGTCAPGRPLHASNDFRSVNWNGEKFIFSPNQAVVVRVLYENFLKGTPDVGGETLIEAADSTCKGMRYLFRGHPAWKRLIVSRRKGAYPLSLENNF